MATAEKRMMASKVARTPSTKQTAKEMTETEIEKIRKRFLNFHLLKRLNDESGQTLAFGRIFIALYFVI